MIRALVIVQMGRLSRAIRVPAGAGPRLPVHSQDACGGAGSASPGRSYAGQRDCEGQCGDRLRVLDPRSAVLEVSNFLYATSQQAQTTPRSVLGEAELDSVGPSGKLNLRMQPILDQHTGCWA